MTSGESTDDVRHVRLLGAVEIERGGIVSTQSSEGRRTVLALLALEPAGLGKEALVTELWPGLTGPKDPHATLYTLMTRVREWLGAADAITASVGLYTLHVPRDRIDLALFDEHADVALDPATRPARALSSTTAALALWGGTPFPGLDAPRLLAARARAEERHLRVLERRIEAFTALDRAADAVETVVPLVARHPDRESLRALLVDALHRAGRPREATEAYLEAVRHLRDEVGVGPGEELQDAYRRVLADRAVTRAPRRSAPQMVGRDGPLAAILDGFGADDRIVVVRGEAGIGKSMLLAAARHVAQERGATVASGQWDEDGTPMAAWFEALGRPPASWGSAPGPWVRDRLATVARDAPLLVTLDDAHRADSASLGVLRALARRGLPPATTVLVAARAPDTVAHPEWDGVLVDLLLLENTAELTLDPLRTAAVVGVARARLAHLGAGPAETLAQLVGEKAGGHPLHAAALLDVLAAAPTAEAAHAAAGRVPHRLRPMLEHQVAALPGRTRRALDALAVLQPIALAALARVLDRRALDIADDLRPAVLAGLALAVGEEFAVRHELTAAAIRDAVPPTTRAHLHQARLVDLETDETADPFLRLRHTQGAAPLLGLVVLARAQRDAGVAAYSRRALPEALALLDEAAVHLGAEPAITVHRGLCLMALGELEAGDAALDAALDALADPVGKDDDELAVLAAVGDERLGVAATGDPRRLARLWRVAERPVPARHRVELLVGLIREEALDGRARPDLVGEVRAITDSLLEEEPGDLGLLARVTALEVRALVEAPISARERRVAAAEAYDLAVRAGDPLQLLDATELLMTAALACGDVMRARELRDALAEGADRWYRPRWIWAGHLVESALLLAEGDAVGADAAAERGLRRGQEMGMADAAQAFGVHLLVRHWLVGTPDALGDLPARAAAQAPNVPAWSAAAALSAARGGRDEEARGHLADFRDRRARNTSRSFDRPALCLAAAAAFGVGDRETALLVRDELPVDPDAVVLVGFGAVVVGPAALFAGLAAWALGDRAGALAAFRAAGSLAAAAGWAPWAAIAEELARAVGSPTSVELPLGLGISR